MKTMWIEPMLVNKPIEKEIMNEPRFRIINLINLDSWDFLTFNEALDYYQKGGERKIYESFVFVILHPETFAHLVGQQT